MHTLAMIAALPWILTPIVTTVRARQSRSLDDESPAPPADPPLVSVVIPARNEERNIERCVRSALASTYPHLEVIAVDDHSDDGTGRILAELAASDTRLHIVVPPPLPAGWFGKQWACATGAEAARGDIIAFFDADTWQSADLLTRAVNTMRDRRADLLSVIGRQEFGTFWERLVQPQVFMMMLGRYGGSEAVNNSRFTEQKIANGQCIIVRRDAYLDTGGHEAVWNRAAEDLAIAQRWFALGKRTFLVMGIEQLTTRMYTSLAELRAGWGKNVFAAGRETLPWGAFGQLLFPVLLLLPALAALLPFVLLALSLGGVLGSAMLTWSLITASANLLWWSFVYHESDMSWPSAAGYALLHPLGGAVVLEICLGALVRGRRVRWKDRDYLVASTRSL